MDSIRIDVYENFQGDSEEKEAEIMKRFVEAEDREYAEEVYKKLMVERSPSSDSQLDASPNRSIAPRQIIMPTEPIVTHNEVPIPAFQREISESSFGISEEDQLMNEAIYKSLQEH